MKTVTLNSESITCAHVRARVHNEKSSYTREKLLRTSKKLSHSSEMVSHGSGRVGKVTCPPTGRSVDLPLASSHVEGFLEDPHFP